MRNYVAGRFSRAEDRLFMRWHFTSLRLGISVLFPSIVLLAAGCHHRAGPQTTTGHSSFRFVDPPPAKPRMTVAATPANEPLVEDHFVDAVAIPPLAMPVFPKNALVARAGLVTIGVRVNVDTGGRVTNVGPSMLTFSTPSPYAREFEAAVRAAVMTWRFEPAYRYSLRIFRNREGGAAPQESVREKTETYFDLSFTFTSGGKVLTGSPGGQ